MTRIHATVLVLVAFVALVIGLTVHKVLESQRGVDAAGLIEAGVILLPQSRALPALTLLDENGEQAPLTDLTGKWTLLFFGYTFCPDICPTTLAELRDLQSKLPPEALSKLRVVLVSVDPARDTPEQLKRYLGYFKAGFEGRTGELADIQTLSSAVSIPFIPADTSKPNYTVDHSGNLALIGPDGRQRGFVRGPLKTDKLAEKLPALLLSED